MVTIILIKKQNIKPEKKAYTLANTPEVAETQICIKIICK